MEQHEVDRTAGAPLPPDQPAGILPDSASGPAGEPYPYHRLTRSWSGYRWWKPLLTGLLGVFFYLVFVVIALILGGIRVLVEPSLGTSYVERLQSLDLTDPLVFGFTLVSLILMIPALALAALITGPLPIGLLSSVRGHIRWGWLGRCAAAALGIYSLSIALSFLVEPLFPGYVPPTPDPAAPQVGVLIIMTLLLVPFQAAAEEYVFRGYLMQAVGSWLRHPAFAILLPVPLFVLGHGYDPLGQTHVALFAVFAGWLTWRTGGLEAAIAAHTVNNATIFLLGSVGLIDVNAQEGSAAGLVISVLTMVAFAAVVLRMFDRSKDLERNRLVAPAPVPVPYYPQYGQYADGRHPGPYQGGQYPPAPLPSGQDTSGRYPAGGHPGSQPPPGPVDYPRDEVRRD
jgi:membrane protease YdiL (CAAX protease family)